MTEENTSPMGEGGLRVVHATPWNPTEYHYSQELQGKQPNGTGIQKGMGDCKMNHQPTHKTPTSRGYDRLSDKRKAPGTWNIQDKPQVPPPPVNPSNQKKRVKKISEPVEKDPKLEKAHTNDLKKRNLR